MRPALTVLNYAGIAVTSAMALLSLFFKFTEEDSGSSRKRLTRPGRIALAITIFSIIVSIGSAIFKDIGDQQDRRKESAERDRLLREVKFGTQVFNTLELRCEFDEDLAWASEGFLSKRMSEYLSGDWNPTSKVVFAVWRMTKLRTQKPSHTGRQILFVETRSDVIRVFAEQNEPRLLSRLPPQIDLVGDDKNLRGYTPPAAIYFDRDEGPQFSEVSFQIGGHTLKFIVRTSKAYSEILGSTVTLAYRFHSPGFRQVGPSAFDKLPSERSYFEDHLESVKIYLNNQYVADLFERKTSPLEIKLGSSEWDLENNEFYGNVGSVQITRDLLMAKFDPDKLEASDDAGR